MMLVRVVVVLLIAATCQIQSFSFNPKKFGAAVVLSGGFWCVPTPVIAAPEGSIVVLGSNGKTGDQIVRILSEKGYAVQPTAYSLDKAANKIQSAAPSNVYPVIRADVTDPSSLSEALKNARAVVFAASASRGGGSAEKVDYIGVDNVAKACIQLQIPRLVVISSGAITRPDSLGYKITNLFGNIMSYKLQGEDALRADYASADPKLSYAIVRPGGLTDGKAAGVSEIEINQGDAISGEVARADVAECVSAVAISKTLPSAVTFEMYNRESGGPLQGNLPRQSGYERLGPTYEEIFMGLKSNFNKL